MAYMEKDSPSVKAVPRQTPGVGEARGAQEGLPRPSLRHTPPGVWPPVAPPGGVGRLVRRLTVSALRLGEGEEELGLVPAR
jgi:hypothetical protein